MAEKNKDGDYNSDLTAKEKLYDSDYSPGAGCYGDHQIGGKDGVELAKKWGGNPGGGSKQHRNGGGESAAPDAEADPE